MNIVWRAVGVLILAGGGMSPEVTQAETASEPIELPRVIQLPQPEATSSAPRAEPIPGELFDRMFRPPAPPAPEPTPAAPESTPRRDPTAPGLPEVLPLPQDEGRPSPLPVVPDPGMETGLEVWTPQELRDRLQEALEAAAEEEDEVAIPLLEEILRQEPTSMPAWEALGWAYWRTGQPDRAVELWERLRAIDPSNPLALNLLAKAATAAGDLGRAIELNRRSLALKPDQLNARYDLARALLWNGQIDEGITMLDDALQTDPQRFDVVLDLARALTNSWQYERALPAWRRLREHVPDNLDYLAMEATCLLHTNQDQAARDLFEKILEMQADHVVALEGMSNLEEFSEDPGRAAPYLRRWMEALPQPADQERVRVRLINLVVRMHKRKPLEYTLNEPIALTRDRLEYDPNSVDAWLLLGELLLQDGKFAEAEEKFIEVLTTFNPGNIRARKGLFETYAAAKRFDLARDQLVELSRYNPRDPYLYYYLARLEATRGDFYRAYEALDLLEEAGRRGAVAVILYHGLVPSRFFVDALAVDRFRDHLAAMRDEGFQFIKSSEVPGYLNAALTNATAAAAAPAAPPRRPDAPEITPALAIRRERPRSAAPRGAPTVPMVVSINFDDGRRDSMQYGTQVAREFGMVFSHHLAVGYIQQNHPFIVSWTQLEEYAATGHWDIGSHFLNAAILAPLGPDGRMGHALPNLTWREDLKRMETPEEYAERIQREFADSRRILQERTGQSVNFISYPFGDIGQEIGTNLVDPVRTIVETGRKHYDAGFQQSRFGFSIAGDDPMFYQRHEMERWMSGADVVQYLYANHPVYLARRTRTELAAQEGKQYLATENLAWLRDNRYPEPLLKELRTYVETRLAGRIVRPADAAVARKSAWDVDSLKPRIRGEGEFFSDNQDRQHWRLYGGGGVNLGERLALDARAGIGRLQQDVVNLVTNATPAGGQLLSPVRRELDVDERSVGIRGTLLFVPDPDSPLRFLNPQYLSAGLTQREFSGDADSSITALEAETQFRPFLPLDLMLRFERDIVPSALAAVEEITYNQFMLAGVYRLRDWWDATGSLMRYDFSDDNTRDHLVLGTSWLLHERTGFRIGLRYAYATSEEERQAYWTPYKLHRYFIETGFLGQYLRSYYNLRVRFGVGREAVRPEAKDAYQASLERARRLQFDPGEEPSEDWEPVFGAAFSTRIRLGDHWMLNGEISYNRNPNYNELSLNGGMTYRF
jgi:tetratricopeptide (TPR) repeat protein